MIYFDSFHLFEARNQWNSLQSLTLDFYDLKYSNQLLLKLLKVCSNIIRLKIICLKIQQTTISNINNCCKNLTRLELVDVTIKVF